MKALVNTRYGSPQVLEVHDRPDLPVGREDVRIRVKRAGLNFADISARVGLYPDAPKLPMVMGYEVAGVVDAVGTAVTSLLPGQRVMALCRFGGQASQVVVHHTQAQPIDNAMSFDDAAAIPVNYLTAYHMLFHVAPLKPNMRVLIHMAAGGVGLSAIQLCQTVPGVEVFGCASAGKHPFLKTLGVHHCIDSKAQDYAVEVSRLTKNAGVHRVLDALGGRDWTKGYALLCKSGHLLCFGWANMVSGSKRNVFHVVREFLSLKRHSPLDLMDKNRSISGINLGHLWDETELLSSHLKAILEFYQKGQIKPQVDKVFPLSQGPAAHEYIQARKNIGKVLFDCEA